MRKITLGKDVKGVTRMLLNGRCVFQAGPLDQGFWPDGIYAAPADEALRFDIEAMKKLGFNMVRKHVKVEPARWYHWCDKLGLLVWQDMPSGGGGDGADDQKDGTLSTPEASQQFETELKALVQTHWNHPSIIMWVVFNEGWGQYDTPRLTKWVKELDPSRLVSNAIGWNDRRVGEIVDTHSYPGPACPKIENERAAVLGEFGGLGLGIPGHAWVASHTWGYQAATGTRHQTRNYLELWRKTWQLKEDSGLCAAVYTQLTDVETESNGLLTYDRKVEKVSVSKAAEAHRGKFSPPPTFATVAPTAQREVVVWWYTTNAPADDWVKVSGNPPALPGRLPEFDRSGSRLRIRGVNRSRSTTGDSRNEHRRKSESQEMGLQIPYHLHPKIPTQGAVWVVASAFEEGVSGVGATERARA